MKKVINSISISLVLLLSNYNAGICFFNIIEFVTDIVLVILFFKRNYFSFAFFEQENTSCFYLRLLSLIYHDLPSGKCSCIFLYSTIGTI